MSKRTTIFLSLLALVTALLSTLFLLVLFFVNLFSENVAVNLIFENIRTAFDLIAEYTAWGIIIFAFSRYRFKYAIRSLWIALGSLVFSFIFQLVATGFKEYFETYMTAKDFWISRLLDLGIGSVGFLIERILPCCLILLIAYFFTKNGARNERLFSKPTQKTMIVSSVVIYIITLVPVLIGHIKELNAIGGTQNLYFSEFLMYYIVPHLFIVLYNLVLVYGVFLLVYFISAKFEDRKPKIKIKENEAVAVTESAIEKDDKPVTLTASETEQITNPLEE